MTSKRTSTSKRTQPANYYMTEVLDPSQPFEKIIEVHNIEMD